MYICIHSGHSHIFLELPPNCCTLCLLRAPRAPVVRAPLVSRPLAEKVNDELIFVFKFMKTRLGAENISLLHDPVTAASTSQHQSGRSGLSSLRSQESRGPAHGSRPHRWIFFKLIIFLQKPHLINLSIFGLLVYLHDQTGYTTNNYLVSCRISRWWSPMGYCSSR